MLNAGYSYVCRRSVVCVLVTTASFAEAAEPIEMPFLRGGVEAHSRGHEDPRVRLGCTFAPPGNTMDRSAAAAMRTFATITVAICYLTFLFCHFPCRLNEDHSRWWSLSVYWRDTQRGYLRE